MRTPLAAALSVVLGSGLVGAAPSSAVSEAVLAVPGVSTGSTDVGSRSTDVQAASTDVPARSTEVRPRAATLKVSVRARGLSKPWDVQSIGNGQLLVTERNTARVLRVGKGGRQVLGGFPSSKVWVSGETGLMGLQVDPRFTKNRRIYTCQGWRKSRGTDVRVIAWRLNRDATAVKRLRTLVKGIPTKIGRHGGCRILIAKNGAMIVGTGDAAIGTAPRAKGSLGGKTLRLNRFSGKPWPKNPFIKGKGNRRYVLTLGHRNVQGLAQRRDGTLWSVEHGPDVNDEVNRLVPGGDYGWHPVPGYNESVLMTNFGLPGKQFAARWRSGGNTLATSGAMFVYGKRWGNLNGSLAVAALATERVVFMKFDKRGRLQRTRTPAALRKFGRLRSISPAGNGDLFITTDADEGQGRILRVSPR